MKKKICIAVLAVVMVVLVCLVLFFVGKNRPAEVNMDALAPGELVEKSQMTGDISAYFKVYEITEGDSVYQRIINKSYVVNDDIGLNDLRYIKVPHYNFDHKIQVGEMIASVDASEKYVNVFKELFEAEYEINSLYLIDNYWMGDGSASDAASIAENNSSCFCYRKILNGTKLSNHALGRAIDINPKQNPYVLYEDGQLVCPLNEDAKYMDREQDDPHIIRKDDLCYKIFTKYGFSWGGEWDTPIDYQHFELTDN